MESGLSQRLLKNPRASKHPEESKTIYANEQV
jgi:hypothetical protein